MFQNDLSWNHIYVHKSFLVGNLDRLHSCLNWQPCLKDGGADGTDEFLVHIPHKPADVVTHIYYLQSMYLVY